MRIAEFRCDNCGKRTKEGFEVQMLKVTDTGNWVVTSTLATLCGGCWRLALALLERETRDK